MKIKKVIRWSILNIALAVCAYLAVIENNEGVARMYQFLMWLSSATIFIIAFNDDLRVKHSRNGPSVPVSLNGFVDIVFALFFVYHGWWLTGIASVISGVCNAKMYEQDRE